MADTTIEWTDATWNPVAGCTVLTAGCTNCYAMRMAARHLKIVSEPGGAAALAAALRHLPAELKGKKVGVLVTGGNVDMADFQNVLSSAD